MSSQLTDIITAVRSYPGLLRKNPIGKLFNSLKETHRFGDPLPNWGDDAAAVPFKDGYLLLAADGMMTGLLVNEPYAAGKASVMVTVNDIYAMGGRPIGLVNVLASGDDAQRDQIISGIAKGCRKLQVPMLGGHLHPDAPKDNPHLSVSILGSAQHLLRSHLAAPGDNLILALDLSGRAGCRSVTSWDANSGKTPEQLRHRLEALPLIAEQKLCCAAKDISNAGILGTTAIMMENSGRGARIDLASIPKPDTLALEQWLLCFQSYGFILSVAPAHTDAVLVNFRERRINAAVVGQVTASSEVEIVHNGHTGVLIDFNLDAITGIRFIPD